MSSVSDPAGTCAAEAEDDAVCAAKADAVCGALAFGALAFGALACGTLACGALACGGDSASSMYQVWVSSLKKGL